MEGGAWVGGCVPVVRAPAETPQRQAGGPGPRGPDGPQRRRSPGEGAEPAVPTGHLPRLSRRINGAGACRRVRQARCLPACLPARLQPRAGPLSPPPWGAARPGLAWPAVAAAAAATTTPRPGGSMAFIRKRRLERELYSKERWAALPRRPRPPPLGLRRRGGGVGALPAGQHRRPRPPLLCWREGVAAAVPWPPHTHTHPLPSGLAPPPGRGPGPWGPPGRGGRRARRSGRVGGRLLCWAWPTLLLLF